MSCLASFLATCLVRTNRIRRSEPEARASTTRRLASASATSKTEWDMASTGEVSSSTEWVTGRWRKRCTSLSTPLSSVAEKSRRCPPAGVAARMRVTPGRNPRSAMWSASSSTVISTASRVSTRWASRSSSRPGQATTMSTPALSACTCRCCETPPKMVVTDIDAADASGSITAAICVASSRVGASTRPSGRPERRRPPASRPARRATSGRANARVLPLPVRPRPSTSRPARLSGRVAVWMGNGSVTPPAARTGRRRAGTPRSANVDDIGVALPEQAPARERDAEGDGAGRHVVRRRNSVADEAAPREVRGTERVLRRRRGVRASLTLPGAGAALGRRQPPACPQWRRHGAPQRLAPADRRS